MAVKVKICGLSTPATLDAAVKGGADLVGFVFYEPSPRTLKLDQARALSARVPPGVTKVALTVDADDDRLDGIVAALKPDMLQAHGSETPARISALKTRYGLPIAKAVKVSQASDLDAAAPFEAIADYLLYDAKVPDGFENALPGGNGLAFDWDLIADCKPRLPFILSGGLNADNVQQAIQATGAAIVDVSSGVESTPGVKQDKLIDAFLAAAKQTAPAE